MNDTIEFGTFPVAPAPKELKPPLIFKQPGIQVRLSEFAGDDSLISVEVVGRMMPDAIDASVIGVRTLRVLGNKEVVKWLDSV